jgi:lysophospholipase L1-like esterase
MGTNAKEININDSEKWSRFTSSTVASASTNYVMKIDKPFTKTFRTYIKPREYGKFMWSFWHSNGVDSTWDDGSNSAANDTCGNWTIEAAFIADGGTNPDGSIAIGTSVQVTYDGGNISKEVIPNERFWSDSVEFNIPENHFIVFTWTITTKSIGKVLPYNTETLLMSAYVAEGNFADAESNKEFEISEALTLAPHLIAHDRPVKKNICFLGDSITQGVRNRIDLHEYWVSKIANGLGNNIGVWNIGSGWARAYDAASDGAWLYKAKQYEEVVVCLGVNDIGTANRNYDQVLNDLTTIINKLKEDNPNRKIILFTVPTFNFVDEQEKVWRRINDTIKNDTPKGVDRVFDIAEILSQPAPQDNMERTEFMSGEWDPHPNGLAGTAVADAFLEWY